MAAKYQCGPCGYIYDPAIGDEENATEDPETVVPEYPYYVQSILDFIEYATGDGGGLSSSVDTFGNV